MKKLEIVGLILATLMIIGTPIAVFGYDTYLRTREVNEFTIIAWAPENGNWSPSTIRVNQGDKVRLRLTSADVVHGFAIEGLGIRVNQIYPGKFTTVEFVAEKAGTFSFYCTVRCGPQHALMVGDFIIKGIDALIPPAPTVPATAVKEFNITAYQYGYEPSTITVNQGDTIKINLVNRDVAHGLNMPEFGLSIDAIKIGQIYTGEFVANKKGTFMGYCTIYCGPGHGEMTLRLIVR